MEWILENFDLQALKTNELEFIELATENYNGIIKEVEVQFLEFETLEFETLEFYFIDR